MVRVLKEAGIGRPSTYSTIISNLSARGLAGFIPKKNVTLAEMFLGDILDGTHDEEEDNVPTRTPSSFRVTDTGESCIRSLYESEFAEFFQTEYTSKMEAILDSIAEGSYSGGWDGFVLEIDTSVSKAEKTHTNTVKKDEVKKGAFPETILGVVDGWTYGKGRTRYGPVIWRQKDGNDKREYKKISSKRWHQVTVDESVQMLRK